MKKLILLLLAAAVATTAAAQAQRDTLTFNNDYYFSKRNVEELVPVTGQNIVMLGNSLTERGFWAEYFQGKRVLNRGIGGDCISGMINRVQPIVDGRPKAIFIMAAPTTCFSRRFRTRNSCSNTTPAGHHCPGDTPHEGLYPEPAAAQRGA